MPYEILTATAFILVGFLIHWVKNFISLMQMTDEDFPGKYDKLIWGLGFFLLFPLTPTVFILWQRYSLANQDWKFEVGKIS